MTAALLAASAAPSAYAAPATALDGEPTAAACETLGFRPSTYNEEARFVRGRAGLAAPSAGFLAKPAPQMLIAPAPPLPPGVTPYPGPRPGAVETEKYPSAVANPIRRTVEEPVSTFSIDVDTAAYSNTRRFLKDGKLPPADAVRVEELINYFDYAYPKPMNRDQPFSTFVATAPSPWSKDRRLIHIGLQGYELPRAEQPPLNLVFLIDTSGSMHDDDRLPLAKKALNTLIGQLGAKDTVAMVAYAGSAGAVLAPTDGRQKLKMRCALESLQAGGSTAGGQGLALAYDLAKQNFDPKAVNRVILLTDGDFNVGVADPSKLKDYVADQRKTGVYLSVYGFGRGNYNDLMMQTLAQNGNGTAAYVDTYDEARKLFRDDFSGSLFPIADDVKIQVEFNPAQVSEYRLIGYETRMLNREDFNNDQVDAGEVGSGASVTAIYEITPVGAPGSSDPLRYQSARPAAAPSAELAFLKVRYKLPGEATSRLIDRPITRADASPTLAAAPEATRWAVAVAAFGQKLRGDPRLETGFGWPQILDLAQSARGRDEFGLRAEFTQLVRAAQDGKRINE
ncbi:VWA domain-containing protein [Caulobacter mirabilis]|uniref:vWA domain-containing protein n=1 Tax=Caulobacter mirabilis TaxID=69666 RepID=UPI003183C970